MSASAPIGVFDSGVGGLSVLRAVRDLLPGEHLIYVADQARVPYGPRQEHEIRAFSQQLTDWLLAKGAKLIVVACNTASTAALYDLRRLHPTVPFVGMEPAVKPAVAQSESGIVGVLATPTTLNGDMYASLLERYGHGARVLPQPAPGLVDAIEYGRLDDPAVRMRLAAELHPLLMAGMDQLVLGCTHFPFAADLIQEIVGPDVTLVDPAPAVARQVQRVLAARQALRVDAATGTVELYTTGDRQRFSQQVDTLMPGLPATVAHLSLAALSICA